MSDADNFLTRWSRRKRAVADQTAPADERPPDGEASGATADAEPPKATTPAPAPDAPAPFDLTKLPSIESITGETDIRAFFAPGVPTELTRAALRRAWVADPQIKNFVGIAENQWDFNNPSSIPGFGPLEITDGLRREAGRLLGDLEESAGETSPPVQDDAVQAPQPQEVAEEINADQPPATALRAGIASSGTVHPTMVADETEPATISHDTSQEIAATQQNIQPEEKLQMPARRGHGGALPK